MPYISLGEGSKEIYQGNSNTALYICSDFVNKCNTGTGLRTHFAVYDCEEPDRLYFDVLDNEVVYIGLKGYLAGYKLVFRLIEENNPVPVFPETEIPQTGETGYIATISQARVGPNQMFSKMELCGWGLIMGMGIVTLVER